MKSRLMILLAAMAIVNGGCRHMPTPVLEWHLSGYNRLHPDNPVAVEDPQKETDTK